MVVSRDGQIVENLRITAGGTVGVTISGVSNVVVRNVEALHSGAQGILLAHATGARVENVVVTHTGAPAAGPNSSPDTAWTEDDVNVYKSLRATVCLAVHDFTEAAFTPRRALALKMCWE